MKNFRIIITLIWLSLCLSANGQNWNCDTLINIVKTTNFIQIHTYGSLYNIDNVDIPMTYTAHFENIPDGWQLYLDDPTNEYTEVMDGSSADFTLHEGIDPEYPEKMIFGMNHNGVPGHGQLIYTIHSLANPSDSIKMIFNIVINYESPLATEELEIDRSFYYAGHGNFHLPPNVQNISLWNINGQFITQTKNSYEVEFIKLDIGNNQTIVAEIKVDNRLYSKKFVIIN